MHRTGTSCVAAWVMLGSGLLGASAAWGGYVTTYVQPAGDAQYSWNSRYGPYGYEVGGPAIGVGLQMGGQYGNDYTIGIIEISIEPALGVEIIDAKLYLTSLGFGTGYWYGSAKLGWQDAGNATGDVVADGRGAFGLGNTIADIWRSDGPDDGSGLRVFDVTTAVRGDLNALRRFSTFVISGSRDTYGAVVTAEGGSPAYLVISSDGFIPEPSGLVGLVGVGAVALCRRRR
ncbi:MAG: PEP-CTERM sorting domain-containing protein [Tepidisphaerales bacterium]